MLVIRLSRIGRKKQPRFRLTIAEKAKDTFGNFLEILGFYNPQSKVCDVKKERVLYWISKGAKLSPTVNNLFIDRNIISGKKVKASKSRKKSKEEGQAAASTPDQKKAA